MVKKTIKLCPKGHIVYSAGKRKSEKDGLHFRDHICNDMFDKDQIVETNIVKGNESSRVLKQFRP